MTLEHRYVEVVATQRFEDEPRGRVRAAAEEEPVAVEPGRRAISRAERVHLDAVAAFDEAGYVKAVHIAEPGVPLEARQRVRRIPDPVERAAVQAEAALHAARVVVRGGGSEGETRGREAQSARGDRVAVRRQIAQDLSRLSRERPGLEAICVERHRLHEIVVRVGRQRDVGEHGAVAGRERASVERPAAQVLVAEGHEVGAPDVAQSAAGERMYRIGPAELDRHHVARAPSEVRAEAGLQREAVRGPPGQRRQPLPVRSRPCLVGQSGERLLDRGELGLERTPVVEHRHLAAALEERQRGCHARRARADDEVHTERLPRNARPAKEAPVAG